MDVYERIEYERSEFIAHRKQEPNKVFIGRDLCGELGIDIYVGETDLTCDDWILGMKIIPTWVTDVVLVTYDKELETKDVFIQKLMDISITKIDKELEEQIDEDFQYLQSEILFERYYEEWYRKKNIKN